MKLCSFRLVFVTLVFLFPLIFSNKSKTVTKYDRYNNECKQSECINRPSDEDCIFKCISKSCYEKILGNYLFELGEVNTDIKHRFESCFNSIKN
jgi:hypothetical protein